MHINAITMQHYHYCYHNHQLIIMTIDRQISVCRCGRSITQRERPLLCCAHWIRIMHIRNLNSSRVIPWNAPHVSILIYENHNHTEHMKALIASLFNATPTLCAHNFPPNEKQKKCAAEEAYFNDSVPHHKMNTNFTKSVQHWPIVSMSRNSGTLEQALSSKIPE